MTTTFAPPEPDVEAATEPSITDDYVAWVRALPEQEHRRPAFLDRWYEELVGTLVWGWPAFIVFAGAFAPDSSGVARPSWVYAASAILLLGLPVAGFVGAAFPTAGFLASGALAGVGMAMGISCRATAHHLGSWWIVETAGFAALGVLSLVCLGAYRAYRSGDKRG
jgi:hypothetical protein